MSDVVIRAEGLGKKYLIGHQAERERYVALRDVVGRTAKGLLRSAKDMIRGRQLVAGDEVEEIWALKDVSFEIRRGEVVGIIGRNGAGKSTLLKILSRITEPSAGRVEIRGRVASLLEVGTGFHPELTGRENIYLNGAILGMTRAEIRRKFDEIVDFAGVEKFLDTPVKRYSSGMYVRLAFAVAAHLEPEILVVDEVLAVGDAEFQKKCLGKMGEVARGGRTVLFVTHNMGAITHLCNSAFLLQGGSLTFGGSAATAISRYLRHAQTNFVATFAPNPQKPSIIKISIDPDALADGDLSVAIAFQSPVELRSVVGGVVIRSATGSPVWGSNPRFHRDKSVVGRGNSGVLTCHAAKLPIAPGQYYLSAWLGDWQHDFDCKHDALFFSVDEKQFGNRPSSELIGYLEWPGEWQCQVTSDPASTMTTTAISIA